MQCSDREVTLTTDDPAATKTLVKLLKVGSLLAAGRNWGCTDANGKNQVVLRRVAVAAGAVGPTSIKLATQPAHLKEFFHHASVRFHTTRLPAKDFQHIVPDPAATPPKPKPEPLISGTERDSDRGRRGWFSWCKKTWAEVKEIAKIVTATVKTVYKVTSALKSGKPYNISDYQPVYAQNWNYATDKNGHWEPGETGNLQIDASMTCNHCFFTIDAGVQFELDISAGNLDRMEVLVSGEAIGRIGFSGEISATYSNSGEKQVTTIKGGPWALAIAGIPIVITSSMVVSAGYELDVSADATLTYTGQASGSIGFGVAYDRNTNALSGISHHNLDYSGEPPSFPLNVHGSVNVYLRSVLVLEIDLIGGPTVGLKPYIEFTADYGDNDCPGSALMLSSAVGMQATVGAQVDIGYKDVHLYQKNWTSRAVYSHKWGVAAGCLLKDQLLQEREATMLAKFPVLNASDATPWSDIPGYSVRFYVLNTCKRVILVSIIIHACELQSLALTLVHMLTSSLCLLCSLRARSDCEQWVDPRHYMDRYDHTGWFVRFGGRAYRWYCVITGTK
jgi:hypothetical protein